MSTQALSWARKVEVGDRSAKAVLRSLADQANAEGICWPGIASIAVDCEMHERTVQRKLRTLETAGLITTIARRATSNVYQLHLAEGGRQAATPGETPPRQEAASPRQDATGGVAPRHPNQKTKPQGTKSRQVDSRQPDNVWDAFARVFGAITNRHERSRRNKAVALVKESFATEGRSIEDAAEVLAEVQRRARAWPFSTPLTDTALANRWADLAPKRERGGSASKAERATAFAKSQAGHYAPADLEAELIDRFGVSADEAKRLAEEVR